MSTCVLVEDTLLGVAERRIKLPICFFLFFFVYFIPTDIFCTLVQVVFFLISDTEEKKLSWQTLRFNLWLTIEKRKPP